MPYCKCCSYWMPGRESSLNKSLCPNCGGGPFKEYTPCTNEEDSDYFSGFLEPWEDLTPAALVELHRVQAHRITKIAGICIAMLGVLIMVRTSWLFPGILGIGGLVGGLFMQRRVLKKTPVPPSMSRAALFALMETRTRELSQEYQNLEIQLRKESPETSERSRARSDLLKTAMHQRQQQIDAFSVELYARTVQLWLNELEGFVAEKLPTAAWDTTITLRAKLRHISQKGLALTRSYPAHAENNPVVLKARRLVETAYAKIPDLLEKMRDLEVLGAVGDIHEKSKLDSHLETRAWLHWLHDALPELENMRSSLSEEDEEHAANLIRGQIRLASDTVSSLDVEPAVGMERAR